MRGLSSQLFTPGRLILCLAISTALALASLTALAANTRCSGSKGGIAGCDGDLFLCNDGSISGSKKATRPTWAQPPLQLPERSISSMTAVGVLVARAPFALAREGA